jgi:hypothetical protein
MKDIVFYSRNKLDIYSPKLLQMMKKMPFANDFVYFCIDKNPKTNTVNEEVLYLFEIEDIPTMYVQGKKLVGPETFKWLKAIHQEINEPQGGYQGQGMQQHQGQGMQQHQGQGMQQHQGQGMQQHQGQGSYQQHQGQGGYQQHQGQGGYQGMQQQGQGVQPDGGQQDQGMALMGAGGNDSNFANPFDISSTTIGDPNFTKDDLQRPMETKAPETPDRYDDLIRQYEQSYKSELSPIGMQSNRGGFAGGGMMN